MDRLLTTEQDKTKIGRKKGVPQMPLILVRNDITKMQVDAIVNPTNSKMVPGGGVDAAIHQAAGAKLQEECKQLGVLQPGHTVLTNGHNLPCKYVIHTVGPRWFDGWRKEETVLRQCYREALKLAEHHSFQSIAFPLIASGALGFPKERVMPIAVEEIRSFLESSDMTVYLVVYDTQSYSLSREHFPEVQAYIDDTYVDSHAKTQNRRYRSEEYMDCCASAPAPEAAEPKASHRPNWFPSQPKPKLQTAASLSDLISNLDEGFAQMLFRKIDEKGMTDAQCYKKANLDRKLFSKIRNPDYKPSKPTILALAIALELNLAETQNMLMKAGFALSHSNKFDVIIEYCINNQIYDILKINEILFVFDQSLLGNR